MEELKEQLINREIITFINQDQDSMELRFLERKGQERFQVEFNGKLMSSTKTFKPMLKEAERLINKYNLELEQE